MIQICPSAMVRRGRGRARATSRDELERLALDMFIERGFEAVTVDDIAAAAGIGRRTFFRYFSSKNDVPWGNFDHLLGTFRAAMENTAPDVSLIEAIRAAVHVFNAIPASEVARHRHRMTILLTSPDLVASAALHYGEWRAAIADFVAQRRGVAPSDALPQAVSWACLGISLSAYEQWIASPDAVLLEIIDESFGGLRDVFSNVVSSTKERR